jgi:acyl-CoA thioesterase-2
MDSKLADLLRLFDLEELEDDLFRGESQDIGTPQVFGGQVLAQALEAGSRTVAADRGAHSLHAYFLRPGDVNAPIVYQIDHALDGRSFSNRRVIALQHGKQIFNMTASFQRAEEGLEHRAVMPDVQGPDDLPDFQDLRQVDIDKYPDKVQRFLKHRHPFLVRVVPHEAGGGTEVEPVKYVWMKAIDDLGDDPALHRRLLAYISDYHLLSTATLPHGEVSILRGQLQMASIDHAMWFHRPCRVDEWLLFSYDSPSASGARGLARGEIFSQDGVLRASTAQEGLIRPRNQ